MTPIDWPKLTDEQVSTLVTEGQAEIARRARETMLQDILAEHARSTHTDQPTH